MPTAYNSDQLLNDILLLLKDEYKGEETTEAELIKHFRDKIPDNLIVAHIHHLVHTLLKDGFCIECSRFDLDGRVIISLTGLNFINENGYVAKKDQDKKWYKKLIR